MHLQMEKADAFYWIIVQISYVYGYRRTSGTGCCVVEYSLIFDCYVETSH